mmetsp:Transcript_60973/g.140963  ORF Transcript_60973/g.140963 Transcript_60973/m.140963 type:complete len:277 (+) Transcript_60973:319-1149(+)
MHQAQQDHRGHTHVMRPGVESLKLVHPVSQVDQHANVGYLRLGVVGDIHDLLNSHRPKQSHKSLPERPMARLHPRIHHHNIRSRQNTSGLVESRVQSPAGPMGDHVILGGGKRGLTPVLRSHHLVGDQLAHALAVVVVPSGQIPHSRLLVVLVAGRDHGLNCRSLRLGHARHRLHALWRAGPRRRPPWVPVLVLQRRRGGKVWSGPLLRVRVPAVRASGAGRWLDAVVGPLHSGVGDATTDIARRAGRVRGGVARRARRGAGRLCCAGLRATAGGM